MGPTLVVGSALKRARKDKHPYASIDVIECPFLGRVLTGRRRSVEGSGLVARLRGMQMLIGE